MTAVFALLADNPVLLIFLLIAIGMILGHVKIRGISLGAAAVLFAAIGVAAWSNSLGVELEIPSMVGTLGLVLFAFSIGVNSGQSFFHNLKIAIGPMLSVVIIAAVTAGAAYVVGVTVFHMDVALIAGTFTGALTSTPALAAAIEASGSEGTATVGYSIAYLFGVIGMLAAALAALAYGRRDTDTPSPLYNRTIRVERTDHPFVGDLYEKVDENVTFSRLRRKENGPITRPAMSDTLDQGDLVTVVGPKELVAKMSKELGHSSSLSLMEDRSYLDFRRITVSDPKIAGKTVGSLKLAQKFSATVSRVRRGDLDMVGEPNLVLQLGDRVRVVAPTSKMSDLTKFFGDSSRGLSDINPIGMGLGMTIGILIGMIQIPLGGGNTFSLGAAGGTLIIGLIWGRVGRIGPIVTTVPFTVTQMLFELGLLVFLAQAGTVAGSQILEAFSSGVWIQVFILGFMVTILMATGIYVIMRWGFRMGGTRLAGVLAGAQTQPAVLAFANGRTGDDPRVALGYALVYPAAIVGKILIATVLGATA